MRINRFSIFILPAAFLMVIGCQHSGIEPKVVAVDSAGYAAVVWLSENQIKKSGIVTDSAIRISQSRQFRCSGYVTSDHGNALEIPSPAEGRIVRLLAEIGSNVHTGSVVAFIENTEFIVLQQEYLEAKNQLAFTKNEYARQGDLTVENATSIKKMQVAQRDYQSAELKFNSLALQLKLLGIPPDSINADFLATQLPVYSSFSGIVSAVSVHEGMYIKKGDPVLALSETRNRRFIRIFVPEEAFPHVRKGDAIKCFMAFDTLHSFNATIQRITASVNPESHQFILHAIPQNSESVIIPGMSVKAVIAVSTQALYSVPSVSIASTPYGRFIFVRNNGNYQKLRIEAGDVVSDKTIVSEIPSDVSDSVVVSGIQALTELFGLR